jgi:hypothetical protein
LKKFTKKLVLHPFLFGVYPIIFLFMHNIEEGYYAQLILPLSVTFVFTLFFFLLLGVILKNYRKSGIIVSVSLIYFLHMGMYMGLL